MKHQNYQHTIDFRRAILFEAKNSKKIFGPNATSGECTSCIFGLAISCRVKLKFLFLYTLFLDFTKYRIEMNTSYSNCEVCTIYRFQ